MEQVLAVQHAEVALRAVVRNGGAAGIDGLTTGQLREHLRQHWPVLRAKFLMFAGGNWNPSAKQAKVQ